MRTKEPPLSSAMVNSPLVAATQPMAANASKALCSEARLLPSQPWYKLCGRTDRQLQPSCHLQGSVAWSKHTAVANSVQEILHSLALTMAMRGVIQSLENGVHCIPQVLG